MHNRLQKFASIKGAGIREASHDGKHPSPPPAAQIYTPDGDGEQSLIQALSGGLSSGLLSRLKHQR